MIALAVAFGIFAILVGVEWTPDRSVESLQGRWAPAPSKFVTIDRMSVHLRDEGPNDDPHPIVFIQLMIAYHHLKLRGGKFHLEIINLSQIIMNSQSCVCVRFKFTRKKAAKLGHCNGFDDDDDLQENIKVESS